MHVHLHALRDVAKVSRRLTLALLVTLALVVFELIAGTISRSLSLYSDAAQNFVDALTLGLACWGVWLSNRPPDKLRTFGYHRVPVLIALFNAMILLPVFLLIGYQAVARFLNPVTVDATIISTTGVIGLACNLAVVLLLKSSSKHLHVRGAYLHNLADAAASVMIIVSGLLIKATGANWIDLVVSGAICLMAVIALVPIVRRSVHILLEGAPDGVDPDEIKKAILRYPEVLDVHDMHVWMHTEGVSAFSCHVVVREDVPHDRDHKVQDMIGDMLQNEFGLSHSTVQAEHPSSRCKQSALCILGKEEHEEHKEDH